MTISSERNAQLDGLRGYAALAVVFFHAILGTDPSMVSRVLYRNFGEISGMSDRISKCVLVVLNGQTAVVIFFILSGAVLFETLQRDKTNVWRAIGRFFVRRFFRIYPALFVCLVACWLAFNAFGLSKSLNDLLLNLSLYESRVNGATWTLGVEAWGAVLLALGFVAYRWIREAGFIIVALGFACLYLKQVDYLVQFRMFIYCFSLGALISTPLGRAVINRTPSAIWPFLLVGTIVARHTIQETIAAFLIGLIYYRRAGSLGKLLSKPISSFLGSISYSLYLFNVLFLEIINEYISKNTDVSLHPVLTGLISGIAITALTIPVAWASLHWIELPFIEWGRLLTAGRGKPVNELMIRSEPVV